MAEVESTTSEKATLRNNIWPAAVMLCLGFASGLPYLLIFDTASAWLRQAGVSLENIGFFFLFATFSYTLKFMWAPVIDRLSLPFLTKWLGHRRGWMLLLQGCIIIGLWAMATSHPETASGYVFMAVMASLTGFFAASQDIVMDAWRIEATAVNLQGLMAACYQWGYRIAMIISGVLPLMLSKRIGWNGAYAVMAAFMGIGVAALLLAPREKEHKVRPIHFEGMPVRPGLEALEWGVRGFALVFAAVIMGSGLTGNAAIITWLLGHLGLDASGQAALKTFWTAKSTGVFAQIPAFAIGFALLITCCLPLRWPTRPGAYFKGTFVEPMADFFRRYQNWAAFILCLILVYRVSEFVLNIMNPFYLDLGFDVDQVAEVRKGFGVVMSMIGLAFASWIIVQFGLLRALLIGAIVGPFSHLGFMYLATQGTGGAVLDLQADWLFHLHWKLSVPFAIAIALDNVSASISGTVLIAYMSSLTSTAFTASQYALFSSIYSLLGKLVASQSGRIVEASAKSAHSGGIAGIFEPLMHSLPASSYAGPAAKLGVSASALGAGYYTFFVYTIVIGLASIAMTLWLYIRYKPQTQDAPAALDG